MQSFALQNKPIKETPVAEQTEVKHARSEKPMCSNAEVVYSPNTTANKHSFSNVAIHAGMPLIQTKLSVNEPGDKYEQEADAMADKVMRMPDENIQRKYTNGKNEEKNKKLQRKQSVNNSPTVSDAVTQTLNSGGRPLDKSVRSFMEHRFGFDFSKVKIHDNSLANQSAKDINALAYTHKNNIVFAEGQYQPGTESGRKLLAHELTHVGQQLGVKELGEIQNNNKPLRHAAADKLILTSKPGNELLQREEEKTVTYGSVTTIPYDGTGLPGVTKALLDRGILHEGDYDSAALLANGYYFIKGKYRVVDVIDIRDEKGNMIGYQVISYLGKAGQSNKTASATANGTSTQKVPVDNKATAPSKKQAAPASKPASKITDPATQPPKTTPVPDTKTAEEKQADLKALPDPIKRLLGDEGNFKPENTDQLLRIAEKLKKLQPEDLDMYRLIANKLSQDLDAFERSIDFFIQFKEQIKAQAGKEKAGDKEPTLEQKIAKTWGDFDEKKFKGMNANQKETLARDIAAQQRDIQLKHMASHPGETAVGMAEGLVRLDKVAKGIAEDVKDAADGNKGGYTRIAGAVGAYNKYLASAAGIVFIALLFVPGVNLVELAVAGVAVASATIVLSVTESELRIKAAGEAKTEEEFKTETAKSAAAQTQAVVAAAMLALTLALKLIARIPLPGRFQNVGAALKAAKVSLGEKTGISPAWRTIKADLISKLKNSKQGLPEALMEQSKSMTDAAKVVDGMSGDEFVKQLAAGDPKLAELGITADQAKAIQQVATTPEGKAIPEQLRQDSLKALQDAPIEAGKKVDQFLKNVDEAIDAVDKAQGEDQLKSAVDGAENKLSTEEQVRQATKDEQAYVKDRLEGSAKSGVRQQAKIKLDKLQGEQQQTAAKIAELDTELFNARTKVNTLKNKVLSLTREDPARPKALADFKAAQEELNSLLEGDEIGGYKEKAQKQREAEEAILESLELKRPSLWQATKDKIKAAALKTIDGKFKDANTGEIIEGEPVYGHKKGYEHRRLVLKAAQKGLTQEQFTKWVNDHPEWFQTETEANNASHKFEKPGVDGWESIE